MSSKYITLVVALLLPWSAAAEPATVQSGEHNAFSRLVTPFKGTDWAVIQNGREVILTYEGFDDGFDTSQAFEFIPRERIQSLETNKNQLILTLACDCAVSAVIERDLYVVIDVADTAAALAESAIVLTNLRDISREPITDDDTIKPEQTQSADLIKRPPAILRRDPLPIGGQEVVNRLQERLSIELSTATRRGVLTAAPNTFAMTPSRRTQIDTSVFYETDPPREDSAKVEQKNMPDVGPQNLANLRIMTSRDLPETFRDLNEIIGIDGQVCPPDTTMAVATWGDAGTFGTQLSEARQGLFVEFDRIDPDVAMKLAKAYVFFGFGAEARDVLMLDPTIAQQVPYLIAMTHILDGDPSKQPNMLAGLAECQGETTLWAMLAAPMPSDGTLPNSDNALRALNRLPAHLRVVLAPKLNSILLAYGDPIGAAATLRSLERLAGNMPPAAKLAQAKTNLESGNAQKGTEQLVALVDENAPQSTRALIELVNAKMKANEPISVETASLVEAFAQEFKNTDIGADLTRAHVIALVQSGQFDEAYTITATLASNDKLAAADLRAFILRGLTRSASDIVFLDHFFSQSDQDILRLPRPDQITLAGRLLMLGFPARAELTLAAMPDRPKQKAEQLLAAQVSLAMGKPFKAQADLLGLEDSEANLIRADAKRMSGAHDEAHTLYARMEQTQEAIETAWLSDDWRNLTPRDAPVFGPTSAIPLQSGTDAATTGMLARSNALLSQSMQARKTLNNLLGAEDLQISASTE